jgi:hypothetical protein
MVMTPDQWKVANLLQYAGRCAAVISNPKIDEPNFIYLMIYLKDLLVALDKADRRVNFTDDLPHVPKDPVKDITELIRRVRNACCHSESPEQDTDFGAARFTIVRGSRAGVKIGNEEHLVGDYDDDIAIWFGRYRLYHKRQLVRVIEEAQSHLLNWAEGIGLPRDWAAEQIRVWSAYRP